MSVEKPVDPVADDLAGRVAALEKIVTGLEKEKKELGDRLATAEKTFKIVFKTIEAAEKKHRVAIMPKGDFYGVRF